MKKLALSIMTAFLLLSFIPTQLKAETEPGNVPVATTKTVGSADANIARLDDINAMDKSTLSSSERKELRKEVRTIKNDQDGRGRRYRDGRGGSGYTTGYHSGGTIYFMGGGGVLLIILLIILLV